MWKIGIDFGTSYTFVIGHSDDSQGRPGHRENCDCPLCRFPRVQLGGDYVGDNLITRKGIPTVIGKDDNGNWCIGKRAKKLPLERKYDKLKKCLRAETIDPMTARLGRVDENNEEEKKLLSGYSDDSPLYDMTIMELTQKFFFYLLKSIIETNAAVNQMSVKDIEKVVIACPGNEDLYYRGSVCEAFKWAIREIGKEAGIKFTRQELAEMLDVLPEPVLAGYALLDGTDRNGRYFVIDVGGGTTDFVVIEKKDKIIDIVWAEDSRKLSVHGGYDIAGDNFTAILKNLIEKKVGWNINENLIEEIKEKLSEPTEILKTKETCRYCSIPGNKFIFFSRQDKDNYVKFSKINLELNQYIIYNVFLDENKNTVDEDEEEEYEDAGKVRAVTELIHVIGRVAKNLYPGDTNLEEIIFVGGSVRIPYLRQTICGWYDKEDSVNETELCQAGITVSNAIALGACIAATIDWKVMRKVPALKVAATEGGRIELTDESVVTLTDGSEKYNNDGFFEKNDAPPIGPPRADGRIYFKFFQYYTKRKSSAETGKKSKHKKLKLKNNELIEIRPLPKFGPGFSVGSGDLQGSKKIYIGLKIHWSTEIKANVYTEIKLDAKGRINEEASKCIAQYIKRKNGNKFERL